MSATIKQSWLLFNGRLSSKLALLCMELLLTAFLITFLPAHSRGTDASAIREITVVSDDNYPPYIFRNDAGQLQGLVVDEWSLWEKKTGIKVTLIGMDWGKALAFMRSGKADVIDTIFLTKKRNQIFDYTKPYAKIEVPIFFHKNVRSIKKAEILRGLIVGVKSGDACISEMKHRGINTLRMYDSYDNIIHDAAAGGLLAFCMDEPPARYLLYKMGISGEFIATETLYTGSLHRAVKKGRLALLQAVEAGFAVFSTDERKRIENRWLDIPLFVVPKYVVVAAYITAAVLAAVLLVLLWNHILRSKIREKTAKLSTALDDLTKSEGKYRALFEESKDAIFVTTPEGRFLDANPALVELYGYASKEEMFTLDINTDICVDPEARKVYAQILKEKGFVKDYEHQLKRKDGKILTVLTTSTALRNKQGDIVAYRGINRDITERKTYEAEIERLNRLYAALSHVNQTIVRVHSRKELCRDVCRVLVEFGGFKMVWLGWHDPSTPKIIVVAKHGDETGFMNGVRVFADDRPESYGVTGTAIRDGRPSISNDYLNDPNTLPWREVATHASWRAVAAFPIRLADKICGAISVCAQEINYFGDREVALLEEVAMTVSFGLDTLESEAQKRHAEEALRDAALLPEQNPNPMLRVGRDGTLLFANPAAKTLLTEWKTEIGKIVPDFVRQIVEKSLTDGVGEELEISSSKRELTFTIRPFLDLDYANLYGHDITERKQTEMMLKESEKQYHTLFEESKDAIFVNTPEGRYLDINPAALELYGYTSKEEMYTLDIATDIYADPEDRKVYAQVIKEKGFVKDFEQRLKRKDGKILTVLTTSTALRNKQGDIVAYRGINRDITERKQAEEALRERNAWINSILEASPAAIYAVDKDGIVLSWNKGAERMFGWSVEEAVGRPLPLVPEEKLEEFRTIRSKTLRGETMLGIELLRRKKDGSPIHISVSAAPLYDSSGTVTGIITYVASDITRQKKMEAEHAALENQLRQSQKMEAIGTLTGGIAHDFNNILSAIISYGYVTLMKMPHDDPHRANIEHIMESVDRAAALIKSLLAFSRKQALDRKPIDLNTVLKKLEKFLARVIGEDIKVRMALGDTETTIFADAGQLEQVFMNLATNARDAMPQGGSFTIETAITELDNRYVTAHGYGKPGSYAMITVSDTGIGMNEETRMRIFDPFFTTKQTGKGTGLGLAMVYGIIKQHEGFINVYSEPGNGTTFRIYLPLSREAAVDEYQPTVSEEPIGGTETILLAEDDVHVRKITIDVLEQMGYTVISANDGEEAVKRYLEHKDKIQLLLFDLIMPKKSGKEAYDEIKIITPGIKGIFLTGYAADFIRQKGALHDTVPIVYKPISPKDLLKKVKSVLNERRTSS